MADTLEDLKHKAQAAQAALEQAEQELAEQRAAALEAAAELERTVRARVNGEAVDESPEEVKGRLDTALAELEGCETKWGVTPEPAAR